MSAYLMGAVFQTGPADQTSAFVLLAIADNADDFGFACPSHELIATKARCNVRTVIRQIDILEQEGWLKVARKIVNGKSNAYFLNLAKMGVTLSSDAKRSPLHSTLLKRNSDTLSRIFASAESSDTKKFSGDNPHPSQVTNPEGQVTFEGGSGDTRCHLNQLTIKEPLEPLNYVEPPTLPSQGRVSKTSAADAQSWQSLKRVLKGELVSIPGHLADAKKFEEVQPGTNDYDACFRDWWLKEVIREPARILIATASPIADLCLVGIRKYQARLERLARKFFCVAREIEVGFSVEAL